MSPESSSPDAKIVDALERRATVAANRTEAVLAHQGVRHGLGALGAVELRFRRSCRPLLHLSIIAASLTGCLRLQTDEPSIGEAFVAPVTLPLREEIAPRARLTATLEHGMRVEILARHRRFAKVRGPGGVTGWTDGRQLLSTQGMAMFRNQSREARAIPPQGSATASDSVNVHITPYRGAPSFHQIGEGEHVQLAARSIVPRLHYVPPDEESGQLVTAETVRDDWSLVCMSDHRCGWVLTGLLLLDLPDEIIQLAEGHRITAFFTLGQTTDREGKQRPIYLWTTSTAPPEQFQFDAFRLFIWNASRDRYEAAHTERNLRGYHPLLVEGGKVRLVYGSGPEGPIERRSFELQGRKLRLLSREPWQAPPALKRAFAGPLSDGPESAPGIWARLNGWARSWRK